MNRRLVCRENPNAKMHRFEGKTVGNTGSLIWLYTRRLQRMNFFCRVHCNYAPSYLNLALGRVKTEMDARELARG